MDRQANDQGYVKTGFGALMARAWKLFTRTLGTGVSSILLFQGLPVLILVLCGAAALAGLGAFSFFDELALDMRTGLDFGNRLNSVLNIENLVTLWFALILVVFISGLTLPFTRPLSMGVMLESQSRSWHGFNLGFGRSFNQVKKRFGKLIVLSLVLMLMTFACEMAVSVAALVATIIPLLNIVLSPVVMLASFAFTAVVEGITLLSYLIAINEDKWHFDAVIEATRRFFKIGDYTGMMLICHAISMAVMVLLIILDLVLVLVFFFPPVLTIAFCVLLTPFKAALITSVYYEQRNKEGYPPKCAIK